MSASAPRFFRTSAAFGRWLAKNHDTADQLLIGFHKKASGKGGMTYKGAVDEALCWGWIDGVVRRIDDDSYEQRFSPRTAKSKWSAVNVRNYERLLAEGRIRPPGAEAYARFDASEHEPYSFERIRSAEFPPELRRAFEREAHAWAFFQAQPPGYRRIATHWVVSAKRDETRRRRLAQLIEVSAGGRRLPQVSGEPRRKRT